MEEIVQFYVGETLTCVKKTSLLPNSPELLLYSSILGTIGTFIPFASQAEYEFFLHLEKIMRLQKLSLASRDHLTYRSHFSSVKVYFPGFFF